MFVFDSSELYLNSPQRVSAKKRICDCLASKRFSAKIDRVFVGLDEYPTAHRYLEANNRIGKIRAAFGTSSIER